jgi:hypothetical protein
MHTALALGMGFCFVIGMQILQLVYILHEPAGDHHAFDPEQLGLGIGAGLAGLGLYIYGHGKSQAVQNVSEKTGS